jgi:membrane carboxypeptidase/penicillin-binding protein
LFKPQVAPANHFQPVERASINIASQHRDIIVEGMRGAIRYGTARAAKLDSLPLTIIGKTGTATPAEGFRTNGWFVGFGAPFQSSGEVDSSGIDLAVLVLLSRAHGSEAAQLVRPIFETYANDRAQKTREFQAALPRRMMKHSRDRKFARRRVTCQSSPRNRKRNANTFTRRLRHGRDAREGTVEPEPEALKALAIAIRTYALKNNGRHATHGL